MDDAAREDVTDYLRWVDEAPRSRVDRARRRAPAEALQAAAIGDHDPWRRARCLAVLDHVANEASAATFIAALADPVAAVRAQALHGLACERCRTTALCIVDAVADIGAAYDREPDPELRHRHVGVLLRFASRDDNARSKLRAIADSDRDDLVRAAAEAALAGGHVRSRTALRRLARSASRRRPSSGGARSAER